ncbi:MAG TPA: hypothetical protein VK928_11870 [Longimicrobiales bacterium]|nr:hypothetical protein [Longimicrobiales bacterium]
MNRLLVTVAVASTVVLAACGGGEVVVQASTEGAGGQPSPLRDMEVRAIPYDRDAVFDSLRSAYSVPEPEIPAALSSLQDSIAQAQTQWTQAEAQWGAGRDSLQQLLTAMNRVGRMNPQYLPMFNAYNALDSQVQAADRARTQSFNRFEALQSRYSTWADSIRRTREQWGDAAFADVDQALEARLKAANRPQVYDTTDANGIARLRGLRRGEYWIHARYDLPFEELYWNVRVEVAGEPVQVQLTRQTAQVRPKL